MSNHTESTPKTVKQVLASLRAVRLMKNAKTLLELRKDVERVLPICKEDINNLTNEIASSVDPLIKMANKEQIESIRSQITTLEKGIKSIEDRATELFENKESVSEKSK